MKSLLSETKIALEKEIKQMDLILCEIKPPVSIACKIASELNEMFNCIKRIDKIISEVKK